MIEQLEPEKTGVVCLHCGLQTPLQISTSGDQPARISDQSRLSISLVRCAMCGKEAPYLSREIVILKRIPKTELHAA
jgi:hypothetical protein